MTRPRRRLVLTPEPSRCTCHLYALLVGTEYRSTCRVEGHYWRCVFTWGAAS